MTAEQIKARLKALQDYEMSLYRNTWDDSDRISDELSKILHGVFIRGDTNQK
jgi:hypothetical protein